MADEQGDAVFRSRKWSITNRVAIGGAVAYLVACALLWGLSDKLPPAAIPPTIETLLFYVLGFGVFIAGIYGTVNVAQKAADWWTGRRS